MTLSANQVHKASILAMDYHPSIRTYLEEMIPLIDRIDARGHWRESERAWLRERYAKVRLIWSEKERLTLDPSDFDLPSRYPGMNVHQWNI